MLDSRAQGRATDSVEMEGPPTDFDMTRLTPTRAKKASTGAVETIASLTRLGLRPGNVSFWKGAPSELPVATADRVGIRVSIATDKAELVGVLVAERRLAATIVNCMTGEDRNAPLDAFEDLHRSVLAEALGGVTSAVQGALSEQFATTLQISASPGILERGEVSVPSAQGVFASVELVDDAGSAGSLGLLVGAVELAEMVWRAAPPKATAPPTGGASFPASAFPQLGGRADGSGETPAQNLGLLLDVPMQLVAVLGRRSMKLRELLQMGSGTVLELDKLAGEPLELLINGKLIGYGEVIVADDKFGIKVRDVVSAEDRLRSAR